MRYWKSKEQAIAGKQSLKGVGIPLEHFKLEYSSEPEDGMFTFCIVSKDDSPLPKVCVYGLVGFVSLGVSFTGKPHRSHSPGRLGQKIRGEYKFRVHNKADREGWLKVFRAWGCYEPHRPHDRQAMTREALAAAAPPEFFTAASMVAGTNRSNSNTNGSDGGGSGKAAGKAAGKATEKAAGKTNVTARKDKAASAPAPAPAPAEEPAHVQEEPIQEEPEEEEEEEEAAKADPEEAAAGAEAEADDNPVNAQWTAYRDEDGDVFYVNNETYESQWEMPEGFTGPVYDAQ